MLSTFVNLTTKFVKNHFQNLLVKRGYVLSRINNWPLEIKESDRKIMSYVLGLNHDGIQVEQNRLTMLSIERLWASLSAVEYVVNNYIDGDIVECGVWKGGCCLAMAYKLRELNSGKKIYLFDTFEGISKPNEIDVEISTGKSLLDEYEKLQSTQKKEFVDWGYGEFNIELVKKEFEKHGLLDYVRFVRGDIKTTLSKEDPVVNRISVLRLDTDWYDTTLHELQVLYPAIEKGGILLVDDYGTYAGCMLAVDEFIKTVHFKPLQWVTDITGRGYVVL